MENDKREEEENEECTLDLRKHNEKLKYVFDYEINSVKPDDNKDLNCKMYYYDTNRKKYRIINYNSFNDKKLPLFKIKPGEKNPTNKYDKEFDEIEEVPLDKNVKTANCLKRLVSKQKRRLQNKDFDLDMAYITERVIAMGFPSTGCETVYRNSVHDVIDFFNKYHNDNVKIYNLCLEKDRIYEKSLFSKCQVGLFPATDHNPCPIELILEFCVDICLYLIKNPEGVAAVHCKAGKGRTGVMICSYLIFSRLCETSEMAFRYYARIRTKDNTGVTIPSQKRYIRYFETFLEANFCPPYIFLIPKIIKFNFTHLIDKKSKRPHCENILQNFKQTKSYFISANKFKLKGIEVGSLPSGKNLYLKICNFVNSNLSNNKKLNEKKESEKDGKIIYEILLEHPLTIHSDIKISITGGVNFYVWVNLWYSSWESIKIFYDESVNKEDREEQLDIDSNELKVNAIEKKNGNFEMENFNDIDSSGHDLHNRKGIESLMSKSFKSNEFFDSSLVQKSNDSQGQKQSLYEIIYKMKHNTDLNELIKIINSKLKTKFNKNEFSIILRADELDKFEEKKKIKDISIKILYSLMDRD